MELSDIITAERVTSNIEGTSKKRVLELSAEFIAEESTLESEDIYQGLIDRERMGSTGIGFGVAIPHCRIAALLKNETRGYLIKLNQGIDFDAIDGQQVELLFILLVPESTSQVHLNLLAALAECFSKDQFRQDLKLANTAGELYQIVSEVFKTGNS